MRVLSDHEVLRIWETGLAQHPIDRALTILATVLPDADRNRLAAMSVGRRDGYLMDVREANFGTGVSSVDECPACGELLEWALNLSGIRSTQSDAGEVEPNQLTMEGYELLYRLPNSTDLAAVALDGDAAGGRAALLRRCVLEAQKDGARIEPASLPEAVVLGLAAEMEARDSQAETLLDFECPACGSRWQALFDVLVFLWSEIHAWAKRLLGEVHGLALAYGWSEEDILGMSSVRRRFYLEVAT